MSDAIRGIGVVGFVVHVGVNHHVNVSQELALFQETWPTTIEIPNVLLGNVGRDQQQNLIAFVVSLVIYFCTLAVAVAVAVAVVIVIVIVFVAGVVSWRES